MTDPSLFQSVSNITLADLEPEDYNYTVTDHHEFESDLATRFLLYFIFGIFTCISSSLCLAVFLSTKELRKKYVMFCALSVGDFLNGLSFVLAGAFRNLALAKGYYYTDVTGMECLLQTPWGLLMVIAGQIPALLHLFVASDKVVALQFMNWYRNQPFIFQKAVYLVLTAVLCSCFILLAVILNLNYPFRNHNRMCAVMNSTGIVYGTVHYTLIAIAYLFCFIMLWSVFRKINKNKAPCASELRRQRTILSLELISVILVSIPNLILILNEWKAPEMNPLLVGIIYCLYATHSAASFFIYMHFRLDFRAQFFSMIGWRGRTVHASMSEKSVAMTKVMSKSLSTVAKQKSSAAKLKWRTHFQLTAVAHR